MRYNNIWHQHITGFFGATVYVLAGVGIGYGVPVLAAQVGTAQAVAIIFLGAVVFQTVLKIITPPRITYRTDRCICPPGFFPFSGGCIRVSEQKNHHE